MRKILFKIAYNEKDSPYNKRVVYVLSETLEKALDYLESKYTNPIRLLTYEDLNNSFIEL